MKKPNELPPFTPVDLRVWVDGDEGLKNLVGSIRLLQWIEGTDAELPLELITAALGVSSRQAKRLLAQGRARGWVVTKRLAKGRLGRSAYTYALAVPPMAFAEARRLLNLRANLAPRSEPTGQLELTKGPELVNLGAKLAPTNIKEKDLKERRSERERGGSLLATPPDPKGSPAWMVLAGLNVIRQKCSLYAGSPYAGGGENEALAAQALASYGDDLIPAFRAYLRSKTAWLLEAAHPLKTFVKQVDTWRPHAQAIRREDEAKAARSAKAAESVAQAPAVTLPGPGLVEMMRGDRC